MHDGDQWSLATSRRLGFVTCAVLALLGTTPATATAPGRLLAPSPVGTVDTVAGPGFCAGPATPDPVSAAVGGLAADAQGAGRLWFETGEVGEGRVTEVSSTISVVVKATGTVPPAEPGPDGARFRVASAQRLAGDGSGGVLIAKPTAVLQLADGLTTVAGSTSQVPAGATAGGGLGDGGTMAAARFNHIAAIAADRLGNVYVADEVDRREATIAIRFLNRSDQPVTFYPGTPNQLTVAPGAIDTIAGGGTDAGGGPRSRLVAPAPALAAAEGRLYVALTRPGPRLRAEVRLLNLGGGELSAHGAVVGSGEMTRVVTVAGAGSRAVHLAARPPVATLPGIAADGQGNLFVAEPANHRIRRVEPNGRVVTVAGTGTAGFNGNDRPATTARLDRPYDVEVGAGGRLYISDAGNAMVRFVDEGGIIHAALGNGAGIRWKCEGAPDPGAPGGGPRHGVALGSPVNLALDALGDVYVATPAAAQIYRLSRSGRLQPVVGRQARTPCADPSGCVAREGSPATATELAELVALAARPGGGLYVQDGTRVRFVNVGSRPVRVHGVAVAPSAVRTVAGRGAPASDVGGEPPAAPAAGTGGRPALEADLAVVRIRFGLAGPLVADRRGNLLIADERAGVRQVDPGGTITTLVTASPRGEDGRVDASRCCPGPTGLALDRAGNVYIADYRSSRVWFYNRTSAPVVAHGVSVAAGAVEAVAGSTSDASSEDTGRALDAPLSLPSNVSVDRSGNLYVVTLADSSVRRVAPDGAITTVAGTGQRGFNGDGLKGALTALDRPTHAVVDACGNLLIADSGNDRVRRLNLVASCRGRRTSHVASTSRRPLGVLVVATVAVLALALSAGGQRRRRRAGSRGASQRSGRGTR